MTQNDYFEFVEIWSQVAEVYNKQPSDGALNLIFNALQRFDLEQIKQGLTAHINDPKHGDFAPKPADIVRHIEGDGDSRALAAWSKVEQAIRTVGPYESVVFDDPRTMAAVDDMGGWMAANSGEHQEFVQEPRLIGKPNLCLQVMQRGTEKKQGPIRLSDALGQVAGQLESKGDVA